MIKLFDAIVETWQSGIRWRLSRFSGPIVEKCPQCARGGACM